MRMIVCVVLAALCFVGCPKREETLVASLDVLVPVAVVSEQFVPVESPPPTVVVPEVGMTPVLGSDDSLQ